MGFQSQEVLPGIHHILDPLGGVYMTLVIGTRRAVLMDTGYGTQDVGAFIRNVTDLPLTVILSHGHHDHALGAMWFEHSYMDAEDLPIFLEYTGRRERERVIARAGMTRAQAQAYREAMINTPLPLAYSPIDLGGLTVQPMKAPGHTPGSAALLIPERKVLLLGDCWNPQTWVFFKEALPVTAYAASFRRLMALPFTHALAPHQGEMIEKPFLMQYAKGLNEKGFASAKPFFVPGHEDIPTLAYEPVPGALLVFKA